MKMDPTYRRYPDDPSSSVYQHYLNKNRLQTLEFNLHKREEYRNRERFPMTMKEALSQLDTFVDPSDPDTHESNLVHAYQTAERIRKDQPDAEWLQVVGLIHDVGKILYTSRFNEGKGEPDWAVVGDIFPVGCAFSDRCVYSQFFRENPDDNKYDEIGIYSPGCGLSSLVMTFGHDEYLYSVLSEYAENRLPAPNCQLPAPNCQLPAPNGGAISPSVWVDNIDRPPAGADLYCQLPPLALQIIRYHSFYPLHREGAYTQFLTESDKQLVTELKRFSSYDLYSKHDDFILTPEIIAYYDRLLEKYFPTPLLW